MCLERKIMKAPLRLLLAFACAAACLPGAALAAETASFTLERLLALAQEQNPAVLAARDQVAAARAGIDSAAAFPNPELEYSGGEARPRVAGPLAGRASSVWLTQRIDLPNQRSARIGAANAVAEAVDAERRGFEIDLRARIKARFYDILRRQAEQRAAQEDLALLEQIRRRVEVRVNTGEAPRYELIKAEAETLNAQKASQSAALRVAQAKAALRQLVGVTVPAQFEISGELERTNPVPSPEALRRELLEHNPEIARARAAARRAAQQVDLERSLRLPSLALKAGYDQDPEMRTQKLGVVLSIPLFDRRQGPIAEAVAQQARARHELEQQEFALQQALEGANQQYQIALTQVTALETGILRQAESALKVAEAAYRFGERGILDYLDAQRVFRAARNELIAARHDLQLALIDIERLAALAH